MSKFIDKMKQLSEGIPQPIGFRRTGADTKKPKLQLLASIQGKASSALTASLDTVDAGLIRPGEGVAVTGTVKKLSDTVAAPWGVRIKGEEDNDFASLIEAGADFIVFPSTAPLAGLLSKSVGRVIEVGVAAGDTMLRTLGDAPVDAVIITRDKPEDTMVTWEDLMAYRRITGIVKKPVIAPVPSVITREELQELWESGIDAVIVEVSGSGGPETLKRLRENIDQLEYPKAKQNEKGLAIAPRVQFPSRQEHEEEEEEE